MSSNELMQLKYLLENVTCIVIKRLIGNDHHKVQFKVKLYFCTLVSSQSQNCSFEHDGRI